MIYHRFYNHVLSEIEAGNARDGITTLVGMLDTVALQPDMLRCAREELIQHYLFCALCELPSLKAVNAASFISRYVVETILDRMNHEKCGVTGKRLADVIAGLPLTRALRHRRDLMAKRIAKAWKQGHRIFLVDCGSLEEIPGLAGKNLVNVTIAVSHAGALDILRQKLGSSFTAVLLDKPENLVQLADAQVGYDLICGTYLIDNADQYSCRTMLAQLSQCLVPNGTILLAGLLHGHFGSGWRAVCLNWHPYLVDESVLTQIANALGLTANLYRDEFDTILWGELTQPLSLKSTGART